MAFLFWTMLYSDGYSRSPVERGSQNPMLKFGTIVHVLAHNRSLIVVVVNDAMHL